MSSTAASDKGACTTEQITISPPTAEDGYAVNQLVENCPPLDPNSVYCNLLQCSHFADTSAKAEMNGELVGFVSGYRVPARPDTLFVWQIAVSAAARGRKLAKRLLFGVLAREALSDVRYIETTITPNNEASWGLFRSLAQQLGTEIATETHFQREPHFGGKHEDEVLLRIGPFSTGTIQSIDH